MRAISLPNIPHRANVASFHAWRGYDGSPMFEIDLNVHVAFSGSKRAMVGESEGLVQRPHQLEAGCLLYPPGSLLKEKSSHENR